MKPHPREILTSIAGEAGKRIVAALGEDVVRTIFVTGSLPRGQIAWFDTGDKVEIYSDVDISVVVKDDAVWEEARDRARRAVRDVAPSGENYEWMRKADLGVYVLSDLLAQPARPGTVDAYRNHLLLHGDEEIPKMMERIASTPIARTEALYLLENRMIERADLLERLHAGVRGGEVQREGRERYALYAAHKTCADAGTAALIAAERYGGDTAERWAALRAITGDVEGGALFSDKDLARTEASMQALADLPHALERNRKSCDDMWKEVETFIVKLWSRLCAHVLAPGGDAGWDSLVARRCRRGDTAGNLRSFAALARRRGFGKARSLVTGTFHAKYSPVDALRCSGLVQCAIEHPEVVEGGHKLDGEFLPYLDRLTRIFGHGDGEVFSRARDLYREIN